MLSPASLSSLLLCLGLLCACDRNTEYRKYYSNRALEMKVALHNGQRTGVMEEFYPTGARRSTVEWRNDRQHGIAKSYYETGQLQEVSHWRNDSLTGPTTLYHRNGTLEELLQYEHDVLVGDRTVFDDTGKPVLKERHDPQGRVIYIADYDKQGRQLDGMIVPVFTDKADTITLGETFETVVSFGFKLSGEVKMLVGKINNKTGEALDTLQVFTPDSNGRFTIQARPNKTGRANVYYKLQHRPTNSDDTLSVEGQFGNHTYYVRPR